MDKALRIEANSRAYHPICEYLEQLEWDGQERIRYVLQRYMGADASDFVYEVVKHFLMEALSRIYRPGCKADEMLCLVGQQGAGKSTFFRFLALNDDWFSDDLKQLNDSKIYEHLRGHWIMEMSEMIAAISAKSNEEIKSFLTRQKDTYRNPYDKYEEDRKRQCIFAGSTNTRQFIPFDRTGARRFLPIAIDSSKAEKHILDDEKEARSYFDQLWAEVMEIYWSTENKSSLLKFSKEMEQEISEYRKQFTQEDTMAGMIQGWLDAYKGSHVCSVQIWKEAFDHFDREPKKFETNEICSIMDTQITGWKRAGVHRFSKEGYGRQRSWIREGAEEEGGNEPDKDGFTKLTKAEQLELLIVVIAFKEIVEISPAIIIQLADFLIPPEFFYNINPACQLVVFHTLTHKRIISQHNHIISNRCFRSSFLCIFQHLFHFIDFAFIYHPEHFFHGIFLFFCGDLLYLLFRIAQSAPPPSIFLLQVLPYLPCPQRAGYPDNTQQLTTP